MKITITFNNAKEMEDIIEILEEDKMDFIKGKTSLTLDVNGFGYKKKAKINGLEQIELYFGCHIMCALLKHIDDIAIIKED